jgi:hypothetical protein
MCKGHIFARFALFPGGNLDFEITTFEIVTKKGQICLRENIRARFVLVVAMC